MSNRLILIILNLVIVTLLGISAIKGLTLSEDMKVASIKQTMNLDKEYQVKLNKYDETTGKFNDATKQQENAKKQFEQTKQRFEQVKNVNSYETLMELAAKREFNIEALWIKLGLIAENNELTHVFNTVRSSETQAYDINVELVGSYSGIRNFIDDIMMDMDLMFKAEDITIEGASTSSEGESNSSAGLKATFVIKNVNIVM